MVRLAAARLCFKGAYSGSGCESVTGLSRVWKPPVTTTALSGRFDLVGVDISLSLSLFHSLTHQEARE